MRYVIIGGGVAGLGAIEGIRELDSEGDIKLITEEEFPPYSRPGISYWLSGKLSDDSMPLRDDPFYEKLKIDVLTKSEVVGVDTKKKVVSLKDREEISYDRLLLATGGNPIVPPIEGMEGANMVFTFTTWKDVTDLSKMRDEIKSAIIVGGGLIGLKAAEALNDIGIKVTVLELMDRILSQAFDRTAGDIVTKRLSDVGIEVITEDTVQKVITSGGKVSGVVTKSGREINANALILAIGVRPNVDLAKGAGIEIDKGVVVDENLMTNAQDVFSAGDAVQAYDILSDEKRVTPILPNAYRQGKQAGRNMAGANEKYEGGLTMNAIGFYGLDTISIGIVDPEDGDEYRILTRLDEEKDIYRKLVINKGRLFGVVMVGEVDRAGVFAGLIRDGVDITGLEEKMLSSEFGFVQMDKDMRDERLKRDKGGS